MVRNDRGKVQERILQPLFRFWNREKEEEGEWCEEKEERRDEGEKKELRKRKQGEDANAGKCYWGTQQKEMAEEPARRWQRSQQGLKRMSVVKFSTAL